MARSFADLHEDCDRVMHGAGVLRAGRSKPVSGLCILYVLYVKQEENRSVSILKLFEVSAVSFLPRTSSEGASVTVSMMCSHNFEQLITRFSYAQEHH